jgi:hypothetical protein
METSCDNDLDGWKQMDCQYFNSIMFHDMAVPKNSVKGRPQ